MNKKFLYFMQETDGAFDTADDAYCVPVEQFKGFKIPTSSPTTSLQMEFVPMEDSVDAAAANDTVVLTITANKHKEVMEAIVDKINEVDGPRTDNFIVIADDSNSLYAISDITACAITVTAGN